MPRKPRPWIVTPHGPLERMEENLWSLASPVPGIPFSRRMTMVRLGDGRIVFLDAVPMDERTEAELRGWGTPAILVVTNGYHRLDIHAFQRRFGLQVLAPAASVARVSQVVRVDGTLDELPTDPALRAEPLPVRSGEPAMVVTSPSGRVTLRFSDGLMNLENIALPFRLIGYRSGPGVTPLFRGSWRATCRP